nr:MAG TPA: hypothetical protein [Caudoviricetes sp.]
MHEKTCQRFLFNRFSHLIYNTYLSKVLYTILCFMLQH